MKRPLRFLHLTTFYPPYSFVGDAIYVERLARALADDGHLVDVVHCVDSFRLLAKAGSRDVAHEYPGVTVHSLRSPWGPLSPLLSQQTGRPLLKLRALRELIAATRFDVIHFHNISLFGPDVMKLEPPSGSAVKLYTAHEYWLICPTHVLWKYNSRACEKPECLRCTIRALRPPQWWRYTGLIGRASGHIDQFIAPSRFSARIHRERGFDAPIEVLPLFAEEPTASHDLRDPPHPHPYFLFAGRVVRLKGIEALVNAWDRFDQADLLVAGVGTDLEMLRARAARNSRVRFLGAVSREHLGRLYSHALACVVPSLAYETFSLAAVEAFASRTPVIARRIGALEELVEECGGGILYDDDDQLRAALERVAADSALRERLTENGYNAFRERWTRRVHLDRYYELIGRVATRKFGPMPGHVPARVADG